MYAALWYTARDSYSWAQTSNGNDQRNKVYSEVTHFDKKELKHQDSPRWWRRNGPDICITKWSRSRLNLATTPFEMHHVVFSKLSWSSNGCPFFPQAPSYRMPQLYIYTFPSLWYYRTHSVGRCFRPTLCTFALYKNPTKAVKAAASKVRLYTAQQQPAGALLYSTWRAQC